MTRQPDPLAPPPMLLKDGERTPWCPDRLFYVLSGDGLFVCRNHEFFESCAPARAWPSALSGQEAFLRPSFPRLALRDLERLVAFFGVLADEHGAEGAALLLWDRERQRVRVMVPPQVASVGRGWGGRTYPIALKYELPKDLPAHLVPFGDAHSHAYQAAYCSGQDIHDEHFSTGVHLVVGRLDREPPQFHVEAVVDGTRFELDLEDVVKDSQDYQARRAQVPERWLAQVEVVEAPAWEAAR
jgi:Prokaryotic homologs of the JAB domain